MFRQFLEVDPVVMCPGLSAFVVDCPSPPFRARSRPLMYFTPTIARMTNQYLIDRVAHDIAHALLGHYRPDVSLRLPPHTCEAEADQLSAQGDFARALHALSSAGCNRTGAASHRSRSRLPHAP
jgi:hypothetical protein